MYQAKPQVCEGQIGRSRDDTMSDLLEAQVTIYRTEVQLNVNYILVSNILSLRMNTIYPI